MKCYLKKKKISKPTLKTFSKPILSKLKPIDIVKNVLLLKRSPDAIITDGLSSPEETGDALLALNKTIGNLMNKFKEYLKLPDSSDKWKEELMEISKRRNKKNKTELKKKVRKDVKEQKAIARKRQEWIKENNPNIVVEQDMGLSNGLKVITTVGHWKIESIDEVPSATPVKVSQPKKSMKLKKKNQSRLENANSVENLSILSKNNKKERKESSSELASVATHALDPFFFTETGENYLSTVVVSQQNSSSPNEENILTLRDPKKERDRYINSFTLDHRKNIGSVIQQEHTKLRKGELHPSWAAKRRKQFVPEFQGKKITFDGNETNADNENGKINKSGNEELVKLHPSWIAKQKMRSNIRTFQGKKLSFADNSDEN